MEERLQKILSAAGICSRRASEAYLTAARVTVNGEAAQLGQRADPETDVICVDGVPVKTTPKPIYVMLNKPRGYVTTVSDEQGRKTVMDLLRGIAGRIYPVGRLDMDSEGLLLLTNDGVLENAAERLARVRDVGGLPIRPAQVRLLRQDEGQAVFSIVIHEGRNRQIRRMCAQCGLKVQRLQRVREQQLRLGDLPLGKWRYLTEREVADLKNRA